jgi:hypothetical protein
MVALQRRAAGTAALRRRAAGAAASRRRANGTAARKDERSGGAERCCGAQRGESVIAVVRESAPCGGAPLLFLLLNRLDGDGNEG